MHVGEFVSTDISGSTICSIHGPRLNVELP